MKKTFLFIILIIILLYSYYNYIVKPRNAETWVEFIQSDVFEKDSENRGFSDVVKRRLDEKIENEEQRKYLYETAIFQRKVLLSKNEDEYFKNQIKLYNLVQCSIFLTKEKIFSIVDAIVENKKVEVLLLHFERERFRSVRKKIFDYMGKNRLNPFSIENFNKKCKKSEVVI